MLFPIHLIIAGACSGFARNLWPCLFRGHHGCLFGGIYGKSYLPWAALEAWTALVVKQVSSNSAFLRQQFR